MTIKVLKSGIAFLLLTILVACGKSETSRNKSFDDLMTSVCSIYQDSTKTSFTDEEVSDLLCLEDSMRRIAVFSEDIDSVFTAKAFAIQAIDYMMTNGYIKDPKSFENVMEKAERIQFEFHTMENDSLICYNLMNCFLPSQHEGGDPRGQYFDFYIYIDKKTGECKRISCILPLFCDECKNTPTFYAFLKKTMNDKDSETLSDFKVTYSKESQCWTAVNDGSAFPKLIANSQLFFLAGDDDGVPETSCIDLDIFHEQYKELLK